MPVTINGDGSITGLSVGGLPNGSVDADTLASNAVTTNKIADSAVTSTKSSGLSTTDGITMYNRWNYTANTAGSVNGLTSWSRNTGTETGNITGQSNMSLSGATFSFPQTGLYKIVVHHDWYQPNGSDRAVQFSIRLGNTSFGADSNNKSYCYGSTSGAGGYNNHGTNMTEYITKVQNTSTHNIQFWTHKVNSGTITTSNTYVDFYRIGDI